LKKNKEISRKKVSNTKEQKKKRKEEEEKEVALRNTSNILLKKCFGEGISEDAASRKA
jgi:hypothetical protein